LTIELADELDSIYADREAISESFVNLIDNALNTAGIQNPLRLKPEKKVNLNI